MSKLKPCPFCGSNDIRFSAKTSTSNRNRIYHFAMYCRDCNCYGSRVLWSHDGKTNRYDFDKHLEFRQWAENAWNRRAMKNEND